MNEAQIYALDVEGYIVLPSVLSSEELRAPSAAVVDSLHRHPTLCHFVEHILSSGALNIPTTSGEFQLDQGPIELHCTDDGMPDFRSDALHQVDGFRLCYGVTAVFALADKFSAAGGITVVPSSHNSTLAPPDLREDDMGATLAVPLRAGDLLLAASTLMMSSHGNPQCLIKLELIPAAAFPSTGISPLDLEAHNQTMPAWLDELSDEQKAVVSARTVGLPTPVVMSDGSQTWVKDRPAFDTPRGNPTLQPPSIFQRAKTPLVNARDLWFFDTRGYLVLKVSCMGIRYKEQPFELPVTKKVRGTHHVCVRA